MADADSPTLENTLYALVPKLAPLTVMDPCPLVGKLGWEELNMSKLYDTKLVSDPITRAPELTATRKVLEIPAALLHCTAVSDTHTVACIAVPPTRAPTL